MVKLKIGVLSLQGAFGKHIAVLKHLGVEAIEVRKKEQLAVCDGLIIPGGESTAIMRQILFEGMRPQLYEFAQKKPIFGTCAGLILMSKDLILGSEPSFGWLDITVERNAYGRQIESFTAELEFHPASKHHKKIPAVFIRAPRILQMGEDVQVLANFNEEPVLVKQGRHLGATFHPELTEDPSVHQFFVDIVQKRNG